jgi:hypothetical protein
VVQLAFEEHHLEFEDHLALFEGGELEEVYVGHLADFIDFCD